MNTQATPWHAWKGMQVVCAVLALGLLSVLSALGLPSLGHCEGRPRAMVSEKLHEFGTVSQGTRVKHDFVVKNEGDADLVIQRVVAACGCTAATASTEPIKAGESRAVHVEFDTSGFSGEKYKTVRVNTNDVDNLSIVLALKGVVEPDVIIEPQSVFLEEVIRGQPVEKSAKQVTVRVREGAKVKISEIKSFSPQIVLRDIESSPTRRVLSVGVDPSTPLGEFRDRIVIGLQGGVESTINLPVFASVQGQLTLKPSQLSFGVIEPGEPLTRSVKFENRGTSPVRVTGVHSNNPAVSASLKEIEAGKHYVIQVRVDPAKVTRDLRAAVQVETDSPQEREVSLSIFGILPPKA